MVRAVVVYESLYGNTAAIARAIAVGLGSEVPALSTAEATPDALDDVELLVVGAPAHMHGLSSEKSRATTIERAEAGEAPAPDLSHPLMRDWLAQLPKGHGGGAAFETAHDAWWGGGAMKKIAQALKQKGYRSIAKPRDFFVEDDAGPHLRAGELDRAREWGAELARPSR